MAVRGRDIRDISRETFASLVLPAVAVAGAGHATFATIACALGDRFALAVGVAVFFLLGMDMGKGAVRRVEIS